MAPNVLPKRQVWLVTLLLITLLRLPIALSRTVAPSVWLAEPPVWPLLGFPASPASLLLVLPHVLSPVVLEPCQTLLCLHPLLISGIASSLASVYPIQAAFQAGLQSTSSRKPSLPATGLTLSRVGSVLGLGAALSELVN